MKRHLFVFIALFVLLMPVAVSNVDEPNAIVLNPCTTKSGTDNGFAPLVVNVSVKAGYIVTATRTSGSNILLIMPDGTQKWGGTSVSQYSPIAGSASATFAATGNHSYSWTVKVCPGRVVS